MLHLRNKLVAGGIATAAIGASVIGISASAASSGTSKNPAAAYATATPIKHLVVIFDENVSFDHYFATYPHADNPEGEPAFRARKGTPSVNGLDTALLYANPNEDNPIRLDRSQALTCDQNHGYTAEQGAADGGLMDHFVQDTTGSGCTQKTSLDSGSYGPNGIVMDYYDGNTVTALWNYAQHYTLSDNTYGTNFGPSTPGAINVVSGNTYGAVADNGTTGAIANGTDIGDVDPYYDLCSNASATDGASSLATDPSTGTLEPAGTTMSMTGDNIGNLLDSAGISWGWFQGGFTPTSYSSAGVPVCGSGHQNIGDASVTDYVPHHDPFQYYQSTANPYHNSPSAESEVGENDPAGTSLKHAVNHQYDLSWFNRTLADGNMPAVSYLKAPAYEDGHAGYSDPLDEQHFLVDEINKIEQSKFWPSTAIVVTYDDSDGWYDHQMGPIIRSSVSPEDDLNGSGVCGSVTTAPAENDRCGVGPRLPLLVISPWAKRNSVDNTFTDQTSVVRFIEDNWLGGRRLGGGSDDAEAGSLMSAFDFHQKYGHAPEILLNDQTGEVEKTIYPHGRTVVARSFGTALRHPRRAAAITTGSTATITVFPRPGSLHRHPRQVRFSCQGHVAGDALRIACVTSGDGGLRQYVRMRAYRDGRLIGNEARSTGARRLQLSVALGGERRGVYRIAVSIDIDGDVGAVIRRFTVR